MTAAPRPPAVDLAVTALAVISPVGLDAAAACAALHAGVSRLQELESCCCLPPEGPAGDEGGDPEPVIAGRVPTLPAEVGGPERLELLAAAALQRAVSAAALARADLARTALLVALPAPEPATAGWGPGRALLPRLCRRAGVPDWGVQHVVEAGPAGALRAVEAARALLAAGRVDRCLVLAADSYLDTGRLAALDLAWRIRSRRNPDGFLPGEAGAALVLEPAQAAARRRQRPLGLVGGPSFGRERDPVTGERWSSGRGLADAIRPLLQGPDGPVGRWTLCNMNGEAYPAREWTLAQVRLSPDLPVVETLTHPADCIGEVGTAMPLLLAACACHAFARGHAPAPAALLWVGSDDGERAAAVLRPGA